MFRRVILTIIILLTLSAFSHFHEEIGGRDTGRYAKTYSDLLAFLESDQTNALQWTPEFNCVAFSQTLVTVATAEGFIAHEVIIDWSKTDEQGYGSHDFVAFVTIDRGIVFIEPQDDQEYLWSYMQGGRLCTQYSCWPETAQSIYYPNGANPVFLYTSD
jgi:hypothetical protein